MAKENVKAPNLFEKAKEEIEAITYESPMHHKEKHGVSDDINIEGNRYHKDY